MSNTENTELSELRTLIGEKVGEASMCRKPFGVFDSESAAKIVDELFEAIQAELIEARINELTKLKDAHSINIFDEYVENRLRQLRKSL